MFALRSPILVLAPSLCLVLPLGLGCAQGSGPAPEPPLDSTPAAEPQAEQPVVKNLDAQPGDVTTCPYSGRPFVVKAEHPKVEYQGRSYWICSEQAAQAVRADPERYLDGFQG